MADIDAALLINLTEDEVPGAKLALPIVEENTVLQLKRWLYCRGLHQTGVKDVLVKRYVFINEIFNI